MTIENEVYYIFSEDKDDMFGTFVDEDADAFDDIFEVVTEVTVNPSHYYKGYFFWNDMDDYEDKDEHHAFCTNSMKDMDYYMDANDGGGHFQCTYVEEWKNGVMIKKTQVSDADGCIDMDVPLHPTW